MIVVGIFLKKNFHNVVCLYVLYKILNESDLVWKMIYPRGAKNGSWITAATLSSPYYIYIYRNHPYILYVNSWRRKTRFISFGFQLRFLKPHMRVYNTMNGFFFFFKTIEKDHSLYSSKWELIGKCIRSFCDGGWKQIFDASFNFLFPHHIPRRSSRI